MANITQWQSAGSQAAYPLSGQSLSSPALPRDTVDILCRSLLDAAMVLDSQSSSVSLMGISHTDGPSIAIGLLFSSGIVAAASGLPGEAIEVIDSRGYSRGTIVLADDATDLVPAAGLNFAAGAVKFDDGTFMTIPGGVLESISINGGTPVAGRVRLVEGTGVKLVSESDNTIRVDAIGAAVNPAGTCPPYYTEPLQLFHVNTQDGITAGDVIPNSLGAVVLLPGPQATPANESASFQMLRIEPLSSGLKFSLIS